MALQTVGTGNLDKAMKIIIAECRFTEEYDAVCPNLVEKFTLGAGEKQITVPKVGQMTASDLVDGVDLVDSEEIGMTTVDLTSAEVGMKVILTDKLLRQEQPNLLRVIGRQMGDAMARKKDEDVIALFPALNGGTTLGTAGASLTMANIAGCIAHAKNNKYPKPISIVAHPYSVFALTEQMIITAATYPMPHGLAEDLVKDFWAITIDGIPVFNDGNIVPDGLDDAIGAIFSKSAMCIVQSMAPKTEKERDVSLRATEIVMVSDYGCFELDDSYGAPMTYDAAAPATDA
jgi:hypothetical protein